MLVVLSGGPGAGKTAVLERLQALGFNTVPDVARALIAGRRARGLSPRPPPAEFARSILKTDIENFTAVSRNQGPTFFERGVVDSLGMLAALGELPETLRSQALERCRYHPGVLVFPPWQAIYHQDDERDQNFEDAVDVYEFSCQWYVHCGYTLLEVPVGTVDERCEHVLRLLEIAHD